MTLLWPAAGSIALASCFVIAVATPSRLQHRGPSLLCHCPLMTAVASMPADVARPPPHACGARAAEMGGGRHFSSGVAPLYVDDMGVFTLGRTSSCCAFASRAASTSGESREITAGLTFWDRMETEEAICR